MPKKRPRASRSAVSLSSAVWRKGYMIEHKGLSFNPKRFTLCPWKLFVLRVALLGQIVTPARLPVVSVSPSRVS